MRKKIVIDLPDNLIERETKKTILSLESKVRLLTHKVTSLEELLAKYEVWERQMDKIINAVREYLTDESSDA